MEANILSAVVATFNNLRFGKPTPQKLADVLHAIQGGRWRDEIDKLRPLRAISRKGYDREKEKLPTFFVSGNARSRKEMLAHSGLVQIDLDECGERLAEIRREVTKDQHTAAAFVSPSGDGLKVIVNVGPVADDAEHARAYVSTIAHVEGITGHTPDPSCKNRNRHCFVSYDPELYANRSAVAFRWREVVTLPVKPAVPVLKVKTLEGGEREEVGSSEFYALSGSLPKWHSVSETGIRAGLEAEQRVATILKRESQIERRFAELWESLVWDKWTPAPHTRNQWVSECVPFLCRVGGRAFVLKCASLLYEAAGIFADSLETHTAKTKAMIGLTTETMIDTLTQTERAIYEQLGDSHREAFMILRDCAATNAEGVFPMSCKELRIRLCLPENKAADRILKAFLRIGLLELVERGEQYRIGHKPKATTWRWLLSTPPRVFKNTPSTSANPNTRP